MVVDAIHRVDRFAERDQKVLLGGHADGSPVHRFVGGVTLNHLGWAGVLGLRVAVFGKQGEDPDGRFLRDGMRRAGVEARLDLSGRASSFAQVYVDGEGGRAIYMARAATAEVTPEEIDTIHREVIEGAATVTTEISQLPLPVARRVLEIARESGARTVVDLDVPLEDAVPALGTREDFDAVLRLADVLKPSLVATRGLVRSDDPMEVARELAASLDGAAVLITTGSEGCVGFVEGTSLVSPGCRVTVSDTTGAGDAFLGGLLAGLHYGLGWEDAARLGNACGACCCEQLGAFPGEAEPTRRRVLELYGELGGRSFETAVAAPAGGERGALEHFLRVAALELEGFLGSVDRASLERAVGLVLEGEEKGARVHVTGVGKPEHLARYAAALLSSTGTPSTFLHATEAVHGSVGQLREGDLLIAISNSGETSELLSCVAGARGMGARIVAVCGKPDSALARAASVVIPAGVADEGGPLGLAPRTSHVAQTLALQALSVLLQDRKRLTPAEYHRRHPKGALGRRSSAAAREKGEDR
jgi:arabinose-5-phosphate isomerase